MIKFILFILFFLVINDNNEALTNGIYKITFKDLYLNYHHKKKQLYFSSKSDFKKSSFFRLNIISTIEKISFYFIENLEYNVKLYYEKNMVKTSLISNISNDNFLWSFIKKEGSLVLIKNKNECLLKISNLYKITCIENIQEASQLNFIKIYEEVNHSDEDIQLPLIK